MNLIDYVLGHATRCACICGKCVDAPENPLAHQPSGHTADLVFFSVSAKGEPDIDELRKLITKHNGDYIDINLLDGKEHNYMEIGAWIGDQGLALMLMGLGALLGLWKLYTPMTLLGLPANDPLALQMAGSGFVIIQTEKPAVATTSNDIGG